MEVCYACTWYLTIYITCYTSLEHLTSGCKVVSTTGWHWNCDICFYSGNPTIHIYRISTFSSISFTKQLLSLIREQYWSISGSDIAHKIVQNCVVCFRAKPRFWKNYLKTEWHLLCLSLLVAWIIQVPSFKYIEETEVTKLTRFGCLYSFVSLPNWFIRNS